MPLAASYAALRVASVRRGRRAWPAGNARATDPEQLQPPRLVLAVSPSNLSCSRSSPATIRPTSSGWSLVQDHHVGVNLTPEQQEIDQQQ